MKVLAGGPGQRLFTPPGTAPQAELGQAGEGEGRVILPAGRGGEDDPAANLALEEAIFLSNESFVARIWENRESVIIGRAQVARFETDLARCEAEGVPVVRRFTAGGAVYNGPGNLNWSLFVSRKMVSGALRYESSPRAIFRRASAPVLSSLGACGVDARLDPPNSLVTVEGKISGMAAYVSRNGLVCHGTLLVSADLARVKALTTPSPEKLERRYARSRDVRTANSLVAADSFIRTFVKTLADETKLTIARGRPDERERRLAEELLEAKYGDERWSLGDPFGWEEGPRAAAEAE